MGGNALKNVHVARLSTVELRRVQGILSNILTDQGLAHTFPLELPGKTSFGDVDALISLADSSQQICRQEFLPWLQKTFSPADQTVNGDVYSFAFESTYQVDFILTDNLNMAKFYFSYGDVGAVLGRCVSAHGLKYGHDGLWMVGEHNDMKVKLSETPVDICNYLDLCYEKWSKGFSDIHQINDWITSCGLFHPSIFESLTVVENRRSKSLRPFYSQFLNHANSFVVPAGRSVKNLGEDAVAHFGKHEELQRLIDEKSQKAELKKKYNAKLFMDRGVETMHLRKTMSQFEKTFDVHVSTAEQVNSAIDVFLQNFVEGTEDV
jgi:hypothetical protein